MILSNCTIPHSGHGYALDITEVPGALTSISSVVAGLSGWIAGLNGCVVGAGTGCARPAVIALRVSVLKKSLALRPGSAALIAFCLGWNQLLQLNEPDKHNTSKTSEIFRSFFILYLLIVSFSTTKKGDCSFMDFQSSPLPFPSLGTTFVNFTCYIGIYLSQVNTKAK
jgi:hypothetical protein